MQYADGLDGRVELMKKESNRGCANGWLLADVDSGEIAGFELGVEFSDVERTDDRHFVACNVPEGPRTRRLGCGNTGCSDFRLPSSARSMRLTQLMDRNRGKIDVKNARDPCRPL
jgi:hypothetical protein